MAEWLKAAKCVLDSYSDMYFYEMIPSFFVKSVYNNSYFYIEKLVFELNFRVFDDRSEYKIRNATLKDPILSVEWNFLNTQYRKEKSTFFPQSAGKKSFSTLYGKKVD